MVVKAAAHSEAFVGPKKKASRERYARAVLKRLEQAKTIELGLKNGRLCVRRPAGPMGCMKKILQPNFGDSANPRRLPSINHQAIDAQQKNNVIPIKKSVHISSMRESPTESSAETSQGEAPIPPWKSEGISRATWYRRQALRRGLQRVFRDEGWDVPALPARLTPKLFHALCVRACQRENDERDRQEWVRHHGGEGPRWVLRLYEWPRRVEELKPDPSLARSFLSDVRWGPC
jgi:hypothetical protein